MRRGPGSAAGLALVAGLALAVAVAGHATQGAELRLTVYAAASLRDALGVAGGTYERVAPGTSMVIGTDSSATLRTQIEQGAPADVFLSADQRNSNLLVDGGFADGEAVDFARNTLVIVVPADNPAGVTSPRDLARAGLKIVAAGDQVPINAYARQVVTRLAALPSYPADFAAAYEANVVSMEENVGAVVAKIELGEGDAALVYRTDALSASAVTVIEIPAEAAVTATYAGVVLKASPERAAARGFLDWLQGPDGVAILATFGFLPPP